MKNRSEGRRGRTGAAGGGNVPGAAAWAAGVVTGRGREVEGAGNRRFPSRGGTFYHPAGRGQRYYLRGRAQSFPRPTAVSPRSDILESFMAF